MLLLILHELWSIIDDSGFVVSSVVSSHPALLAFHMLAGNLDRAPSRTQWREFSMPQCCRTAWANRTPCAGREVRKYRVSTWTVFPTSRRASTIPTLCKLDQEALAPSHSISDVIQYRRVSMRPWSPSTVS